MKKLIAITGASSGIGAETAKLMSEQGHPLLLLARNQKAMEQLALPNSLAITTDVTDIKAMQKAIQQAENKFGKIDLLINCAGVMQLDQPENQPYEEWERMIDVNIKGILTGTHILLKDMVKRNQGTIINISSIAGRKNFPNHAIYCGTKFAVHAITENIRQEISHTNVRLITIAPGVVETPLLEQTNNNDIKHDYENWKTTINGGLTPQKIAECILFAYNQPQDICIREIVIAKTKQTD